MKTSWNDMQAIEGYALSSGNPEDRVLFQARLLLEPQLKASVHWQQETYALAREYGRLKLKTEIEEVANEVFTAKKHESFRQKIRNIFSK
ncbi:hypothetical protein AAEO56_00295 [Flavobacterium sp. DGU11]|uniref:Uncharacterized protein n=1 Tax=Flavobacterium arundinis TaxID=3139143 RepID=A0ABU9HRZ0_9FLAO